MGELEFLQRRLGEIAGTETRNGEIDLIQERLDSYDKELSGENLVEYNRLQEQLAELQRMRDDLTKLIQNYNDITSEQAQEQELEKIDSIISNSTIARNLRNTATSREGRMTGPSKEKYTYTNNIDLTIDATDSVSRDPESRKPANVRINRAGNVTVDRNADPIEAMKQVITLQAVLDSSRDLSSQQRSRIERLRNRFNEIAEEYYTSGPEIENEQNENSYVSVVRKEEIRSKISAYENGSSYDIEVRMTELIGQVRELQAEHAVKDENGELKLGENGDVIMEEGFEGQLEALRQRIHELAAQRTPEVVQRGQDVLPVLRELEQLTNVPNIEFEAIFASEVDKRLDYYRKLLEQLKKEQEQGDDEQEQEEWPYKDLTDEELKEAIEKHLKGDDYNFRAHEENGLEEHPDRIGDLLFKEQTRRINEKKERPFKDLTDEELHQAIDDEYNFRAHQENGMEEHPDGEKSKWDLLIEEQSRRNKEKAERPYKDLTDDELKEAIDKHLQDFNFRAHEENGLEEHEDKVGDELFKEQSRRIDEKNKKKNKAKKKDNSKEIKKIENIIKELEGLNRERAKANDKSRDPNPPGGGPGGDPVPPRDPGGDPIPPKDPKKLPRHWVEIMAEVQTESAGSVAQYFHNMSKIKPFRAGITFWAFPVKAAMKGIGALGGNLIGRVEAKKNIMRQNIKALIEKNPEEFEILVNGLTETNMRQYKVNEAFLDVVQEVLTEREETKKQQAIDKDNVVRQAKSQAEEQIASIQKQLQDLGLDSDKKLQLQAELQRYSMAYTALELQHQGLYQAQINADKRVTDFDRGKTGKSTRRMNIQGWLAGSFNPDNRDIHKQEAELLKQQREASEKGDVSAVATLQTQIDELHKDNTHVIKFLKGTRFESRARINRGKHTVEEIHQRSNDADQTKARELIATIMAGVTAANIYTNWKANQNLQQQVDQHLNDYNQNVVKTGNQHNAQVQQDISSANAHNAQVQQEIDAVNAHNQNLGQQIQNAKGSVTEQQIRDAGITEIHRNNAGTYSISHEAEFVRDNTPGVGFNHNHSDEAIHAAQPGMTSARQVAESGSLDDIAKEVVVSQQRMQNAGQAALQDVQGFTQIAGKSAFVNSEYVQNLQYLTNGGTDSFTLLNNLFKSIQQMDNPELVTGTIEQVGSSVQQISEISPLLLVTTGSSMTNWLPFVTSMVNVAHLEQQKAERQINQYEQERQETQEQRKERETRRKDRQDKKEQRGKDISDGEDSGR